MNARRFARLAVSTLVAGGFAVVCCIPVAADADPVFAAGTAGCNVDYGGLLHSCSTGQTWLSIASAYKTYYNGGTWTHRQLQSSHSGSSDWAVEVTNGSLNASGTYSTCILTGVYP